MTELDRVALLDLTPEVYLADGWLDAQGRPRPHLRTDYAAAAVAHLHASEAAAEEVGFTIAGIGELLSRSDAPDPGERLWACLDEACETVASMIGQPNNPGLRAWLYACASAVETEAELAAFLDHLQAVNLIYAHSELIAAPEG